MHNRVLRRLDESVFTDTERSAVVTYARMCDSDNVSIVVRDIAALANLRTQDPRLIVFGVVRTDTGIALHELCDDDHAVGAKIERIGAKYLEPQLRLRYVRWRVRSKSLGVLLIENCDDAPYVVRKDVDSQLRAGDIWVRRRRKTVRMRRSELDKLYAEKLAGPLYHGRVRVQFAGDVPSEFIRLKAAKPADLPSAVAAEKISALIEARRLAMSAGTSEMTYIGRLSQARIFGCDTPYDDKGINTLKLELEKVAEAFQAADRQHRIDHQAHSLNLQLAIDGDSDIECASLVLHIPANVGVTLPEIQSRESTRSDSDAVKRHPDVDIAQDVIRISENYDRLQSRRRTAAFRQPLKVVIEPRAVGHKIPVHYRLHGKNLANPVSGKLYIICAA